MTPLPIELALLTVLAAAGTLGLAARRELATAWLPLPALLLCVWAGTTLPDIDLPLPLDHRSGFTHSVLPGVAALVRRWAWPAAGGLFLGLGLHLAADFFPNGMTGFATIKLPLAGSIGANASYWWIGVNALACGVAGGWLTSWCLPAAQSRVALAGAAVIGLLYLLSVDGGWWALALLLLAGGVSLRLSDAWPRLVRR